MQDRLSSTNEKRITNRQHMNDVAEVEDDVQEQHQLYNRKVDEVQDLLEEIQQKLDQAKNELRSAVRSHKHMANHMKRGNSTL